MVYIQEHPISLLDGNNIKQGTATSFYGQQGYKILQHAQDYGEVLTLPEFLQVLYLLSFQSSLLEIPFTVRTEEIIGKSRQGNNIAIVVHGAGLLTPKRICEGINIEPVREDEVPDHGLTRTKSGKGQFALPLYDYEIHALLEGDILPIFTYDDFKKDISSLPREYAVVRDFHPRTEVQSEYRFLSTLEVIPRVVSLAGGSENLELCLDALNRCGLKKINYSHSLNYLEDVDLEQPQGRFIEVHGVGNLFYGGMEMDGPARFLSVQRDTLEEKIDKEVRIEV